MLKIVFVFCYINFEFEKFKRLIPQNCKYKKVAQTSFPPQEIYFECLHSFIFEIHQFLYTAGKTKINIIVQICKKAAYASK